MPSSLPAGDSATMRLSRYASWFLAAAALFFILHAGLLAALLSGLLVHSLVHLFAPHIERRFAGRHARLIVAGSLAALVIAVLSAAGWGTAHFLQSDAGNLQSLFQRLADIVDTARGEVPAWLGAWLPADADALHHAITTWLREHAVAAQALGEQAGRALAHILLGMVIGAMVAMHDAAEPQNRRPLAAALGTRLARLSEAFERIVFAQVRIAAINAVLTALYLLVLLPLMGIHLPLAKTLVLITFLAGLLPVIGNLISNTVIVLVALSHSLGVAGASLGFLVVVHKLEYFLNARIIGSQIQAHAWELLVAMLAMEAAFGLYGVIAAPVFYAYLKAELTAEGLV